MQKQFRPIKTLKNAGQCRKADGGHARISPAQVHSPRRLRLVQSDNLEMLR